MKISVIAQCVRRNVTLGRARKASVTNQNIQPFQISIHMKTSRHTILQSLFISGVLVALALCLPTRSAVAQFTQQQQLTAADGAALDQFGGAVAISGDTAVVGAPYDTVGANFHKGTVY